MIPGGRRRRTTALVPGKRGSAVLLLAALLVSVFSSLSGASAVHGTLSDGGVPTKKMLVSSRKDASEQGSPFVLASARTHRKDPFDGYRHYAGGWNISEYHYWTSVGFTAAPLFLIAVVWFLGFGLVLLLLCCCYCCFPRRSYSYSRVAYACSLVFLILFTFSAVIGCIVLYTGQGKFHSSTTKTLDYIVGESQYTVENLQNFSDSLSAAKRVRVKQFFLSQDEQNKIVETEAKLNTSASKLETQTKQNSKNISKLLNTVRWLLIVIAAAMLLLAFLGFLFSIFGFQHLVYSLVIVGWFFVTGTFILSGVFLLLHNVAADTCAAMDDWVKNPHEHTALDDILPCVDVATANQSFLQSKEVTFNLVKGINQVIDNVANQKFSSAMPTLYYNQSGPLAPTVCNPWTSSLTENKCTTGQVSFGNASQVWKSYVCKASGNTGSEICTTVGRFTPDIYSQLTAAVSVSFGIYNYFPFLVKLEDCTFVRDTFSSIYNNNCPDLGKFSRWVYIGLTMVSAAVMLSLILWVIYARERRHRVYGKQQQFMRNKD